MTDFDESSTPSLPPKSDQSYGLRTRIAELQRFHIPVDYAGYIECSCGVECKPEHGGIDVAEQMWGDHVADAVIQELCMHRQEMSEWDVLANGFRGHRYVTHWEENDE